MRSTRTTMGLTAAVLAIGLLAIAPAAWADNRLIGDINGDGVVDFNDIDAFVAALSTGGAGHVGPIAHWTFDEGQGSIAYDITCNGHDLALMDGAGWSTGIVGDGALSTRYGYALAPNASVLALPGSYTVALWIKYDGPGQSSMGSVVAMHHCGYNDTEGWDLLLNSNWSLDFREYVCGAYRGTDGAKYCAQAFDPDWGFVSATPALGYDMWFHVAFAYDDVSNVASIYVNNELVRQGPWESQIGGCTIDLTVGTDHLLPDGGLCGQEHFFPGDVDDLRIYDRALTAAEVSDLLGCD